jgi:hypothetical protein
MKIFPINSLLNYLRLLKWESKSGGKPLRKVNEKGWVVGRKEWAEGTDVARMSLQKACRTSPDR